MPPSIPYLNANAIRASAEKILAEHQPDGGIPVQIEDIIEFGFQMEIRPVRALQARFGFEGALSYDLQTILVDEHIMARVPNRYRFTLAHELGHRILHADFIASLTFENREEWKAAVSEIDSANYGRLEHQGYIFAGYLLVPTESLRASCEEARILAQRHGIDLTTMGTSAIAYVAGHIAKDYKVSTEVMQRRIAAERIFDSEE